MTDYIATKRRDAENNAPIIQKEIGERKNEMDELIRRLADPRLPGEAVSALGDKIAELKRQIDALEQQLNAPRNFTPPEISSYLRAIADINPDDPHNLRGSLRHIVQKIEVNENEFRISSILNSFAGELGNLRQL